MIVSVTVTNDGENGLAAECEIPKGADLGLVEWMMRETCRTLTDGMMTNGMIAPVCHGCGGTHLLQDCPESQRWW